MWTSVFKTALSILPFFLMIACSEEGPSSPQEKQIVVKKIVKAEAAKGKKPSARADTRLKTKSKGTGDKASTPTVEDRRKSVSPTPVSEAVEDRTKGEYYTVRKGDTLAGIAGLAEIYGDSLKWPLLLRSNLKKLVDLGSASNLPDRILPGGIKLRFLSEDEINENLKKRADRLWVVNVLSSTRTERITPNTIYLVKAGYPTYISTANIDGKEWMRLRIGFFKNRKEAQDKGKRVMNKLGLKDSWVTKIKEEEFAEYAGY
jgi:hypothetical protein